MPILQDKIRVPLTSSNISYYEELGYLIPRSKDAKGRLKVKEGTWIIVDLKDLPRGCGIKVNVQCDVCGKCFSRIWRDHQDRDGKIYCKNCAGVLRRGDKAYNWNPNLSQEDRINGRDYQEYHDFIQRVLNRDQYTCKVCGQSHGNIRVHHLNGYNWCVEERTLDDNGVTLCEECHLNFHSIYGKGSNTREQFEEWIGQPIEKLGEGIFPPARQVICMDDGKVYKSAPCVAKEFQLDRNSLYPVLNKKYRQIYNNHFLWYDDYMSMSKEDVSQYWRWVIGKADELEK